ncbi:MAG: hypothetical protein RIB86_25530 [Imperialibacter sp.]
MKTFKNTLSVIFILFAFGAAGQKVCKEDSAFIFKQFLFYHSDEETFDDIDEPYIEEYWNTNTEKAKKYYALSAYLTSIPIDQRVIMVGYLDDQRKLEVHKWMLANLKSPKEKSAYFMVLGTSYGVPYSSLGLSKDEVLSHCPNCKYK